jgi:hypothetical protein
MIRIGNAYIRGRWSASMVVHRQPMQSVGSKRRRRSRSVVVGLPDLHGECHGVATAASVRLLRRIKGRPVAVSLFADGGCLKGPAWVDLSMSSMGGDDVEVSATFVATGAWKSHGLRRSHAS